MLKRCIVCNTWFDARGSAKCCSPECKRERKREWYRNNPEYRERAREYQRERMKDPEYRERKRERDRERYHNDPEYREWKLERDRERLRKKQLDKKLKSLQTGIEQFLKEKYL